MADPRLEVNDGLGRRVIPIDKATLTIGRRTESDVRLVGSDVSREHAEILREDGALVLKDRGSRYGTFVNGEAITEHRLAHGDRVQFGRTGGAEVVYLTDSASSSGTSTAGTAVGDIRQMATLLEGLRALGSGRCPRRGAGPGPRRRHRRDRRRTRVHHARERRRPAGDEAGAVARAA